MNLKKLSIGFLSFGLYFEYYKLNRNNSFHGFSIPFFWSSKKNNINNLFLWGNCEETNEETELTSYDNFEPKLIENLSTKDISFKKIKLGNYFDVGIDLNNNLFYWPKHKINFRKSKKDNIIKNIQKLKIPNKNVIDVQITQNFLWLWDKNGNLYKYEILNQKNNYLLNKYSKIKTVKNLKKITTNLDTLIMLDKNGNVFSMGDDSLGQCGQGLLGRSVSGPFLENKISNPFKINFNKKIIDISSGDNHNLAIDEEGKLYGWGSNHYIQLGDEIGQKNIQKPNLVKFEPYLIENENFKNIKFNIISCGEKFSIMGGINKENNEMEIFGCGFNLKGQLGNGYIKHYSEIKRLNSLSNLRIKKDNEEKKVEINKLKCGKDHCLALTNLNILLEWGNNSKGQLGNRKKGFNENPLIISTFSDKKIVDFEAGNYDSFVIIENELKNNEKN